MAIKVNNEEVPNFEVNHAIGAEINCIAESIDFLAHDLEILEKAIDPILASKPDTEKHGARVADCSMLGRLYDIHEVIMKLRRDIASDMEALRL